MFNIRKGTRDEVKGFALDEVEDARYARDDADRRADAAWETWRQDMDNAEARADYEAARKMYEEDQARYSALYRLAHPGDDGQ